MNKEQLNKILEDVANGKITPDEAGKMLKTLPFHDLGFAKVDNHRGLRAHSNEVVFCQGKAMDHILGIVENMVASGNDNIMLTRVNETIYQEISRIYENIAYHKLARIIIINPKKILKTDKKILVLTAGTADIPVADEAAVTAEVLGNPVERIFDVGVAGLHRLLARMEDIQSANVIITVAGMEGALTSVVGGLTNKPVIGVPTSVGYGSSFNGLSALLTMLNSCASGVGVVNIDNGFGAGYLASIINQL